MDKWEVLRKNLEERVKWCNHVSPHLPVESNQYRYVYAKRKANEQLLLLMNELDRQ